MAEGDGDKEKAMTVEDVKKVWEHSERIWAEAIRIAKKEGKGKALAYLEEQGCGGPDTAAMLGMALGTWEHITRDENGKIVMIRN